MLRITQIDHGSITIFRLEGRLVGDWVAELERCWTGIKATDPNRKFKIDLTSVDFVDDKGEKLLERMLYEGAEIRTGDLFMKWVVDNLKKHAKAEHASY
jgi:hypothetical protein